MQTKWVFLFQWNSVAHSPALRCNSKNGSEAFESSQLPVYVCDSMYVCMYASILMFSSGNTREQSSQLAELLWTDPGLKNGIILKCRQEMNHGTFSQNPCMQGKGHHHHLCSHLMFIYILMYLCFASASHKVLKGEMKLVQFTIGPLVWNIHKHCHKSVCGYWTVSPKWILPLCLSCTCTVKCVCMFQ